MSAGHSRGGRKGGTTATPAENGLCADYPLTEAESTAKRDEWLPTERDAAHLASLMVRQVRQLDRAARARHQRPTPDFEYVKLTPRG